MVSAQQQQRETLLRRRATAFLSARSRGRAPLHLVVSVIRQRGWNAFLFGGVLRDLMISGRSLVPRDVDIVLEDVSLNSVREALGTYIVRTTRFGGIHLNVGGWPFDIWPLGDTWAFRERLVPSVGFTALPRTTFLNVEAAAIQICTRPGRARQMVDHGFFAALGQRTIDINLEANPFPLLCVVRSLITAARLRFLIAPRLGAYIDHHSKRACIDEMVSVQVSHYGRVRLAADELNVWLAAVREQLRQSRRRPIALPVLARRQLELWTDAHMSR